MSDTTVSHTEKRISTQPAGYLLSKAGLAVLLAGLLLAVWYGQTIIVILLALCLGAAGLAWLWSRFSLAAVSCERTLGEHRAFPGDQVELKLRLVNRKLLPLPWIQIDDQIPLGFSPDLALEPGTRPGFGLLSRSAALLWYTGASWRHRLQCRKRGYYTLGPMVVTSGDIFGFYPRSMALPSTDVLIVYPRIFRIAQLGIPSLYPLGETKVERRICEDPTRTVGVRDYSPQDSLRRIHWKATARHQNLKVRVYEPTTTLKVAIFLAVDSFPNVGAEGEGEFELGVSVAASVASYVTEQHSQVGLFVNSRLVDSGQPARIPPGGTAGHLVRILETLAKVTAWASGPFEGFLQNERAGMSLGTTLMIVLGQPSESISKPLVSLKEAGYKLVVLQVSDRSAGGVDGAVTWHNIQRSDGLVRAVSGQVP